MISPIWCFLPSSRSVKRILLWWIWLSIPTYPFHLMECTWVYLCIHYFDEFIDCHHDIGCPGLACGVVMMEDTTIMAKIALKYKQHWQEKHDNLSGGHGNCPGNKPGQGKNSSECVWKPGGDAVTAKQCTDAVRADGDAPPYSRSPCMHFNMTNNHHVLGPEYPKQASNRQWWQFWLRLSSWGGWYILQHLLLKCLFLLFMAFGLWYYLSFRYFF